MTRKNIFSGFLFSCRSPDPSVEKNLKLSTVMPDSIAKIFSEGEQPSKGFLTLTFERFNLQYGGQQTLLFVLFRNRDLGNVHHVFRGFNSVKISC